MILLHRFSATIAILISFATATSATSQQVEILSPNGGEIFKEGDTVTVTWKRHSEDTTSMTVEFSNNGGRNWETLCEATKESSFVFSTQYKHGDSCLIRVRNKNKVKISPQLFRSLPIDTGYASWVEFSSDGKSVVTTGWDYKIRLWDLVTGKNIRTYNGHSQSTLQAKFSPDGSELTSTSLDSTIRFWNRYTGELKKTIKYNDFVWAISYSPDGKEVAISDNHGNLELFNANTKEKIESIPVHTATIRNFSYTDSGKEIVTCSGDRTASVVDAIDRIPITFFSHQKDATQTFSQNIVNSVVSARNDSLIITSGFNGFVRFWDRYTEEEIAAKRYHGDTCASSVNLSPDERWLLSVGYDSTIQIIDMRTLEPVTSLRPNCGLMISAQFSPDGKFFACSHLLGVTIWLFNNESEDTSDKVWAIRPSSPSQIEQKHQY